MNCLLQQDIATRQHQLQQLMMHQKIDACILATNVNVFYMTATIYNGYYYLPLDGKPIHFVKRGNVDFHNTVYIRKPEQISEELEKRGLPIPKTAMLELDVLSYGECTRLMNVLNIIQPTNASAMMRQLRSVKTDFELAQIRACARKHEAVYKQVPALFRRGMTDVEYQIEIEHVMRSYGSMGIFRTYGANMDIYMGSLLSGDNAETPSPFDFALGGAGAHPSMPLGACGKTIEQGQSIMVDMAGNYSPWMTDMTRVFSVGKLTPLAYKAHQISIEIQNKVMSIAKPGIACSELYNMAMKIVKDNDLEPYFMGTNLQAKFIGHGVGLEINEPPVITPSSQEVLQSNMVFALEPKFVIPKVGAVGIENTFVVTSSGLEKITQCEENIIELG